MTQSYFTIKAQNDTLYDSILNMREQYSTDNSRKQYKNDIYDNLKYVSDLMFYIYYGFLILFILFIYFSQKLKWYMKIVFIGIFGIYPFFIYFFENFIFQWISYAAYYA
jgi:hypothetical protein